MSVDPLIFILMFAVFLAIGILTYVLVAGTVFKEYVPPTRAFFWDSIVESKYAQPKKMIADTARAYALFYCSIMFWSAVAFVILGVDPVPVILLCLGTSALYALISSRLSIHYTKRSLPMMSADPGPRPPSAACIGCAAISERSVR